MADVAGGPFQLGTELRREKKPRRAGSNWRKTHNFFRAARRRSIRVARLSTASILLPVIAALLFC